ncbi:MAG: hypothetical protein ABI318_15020 [Chthoniobacteraceae bacterium]
MVLPRPARVEVFVRFDFGLVLNGFGHFSSLDLGVRFAAVALPGHFTETGIGHHTFLCQGQSVLLLQVPQKGVKQALDGLGGDDRLAKVACGLAIRPDGSGSVTDDRGYAHAFDAKTGDIVWSEKFGRSHASIVSAAGLLYFMNDAGVCRVVKPSEKFATIAANDLGEPAYASTALSNGQIFLRTEKAIYCIGQKANASR